MIIVVQHVEDVADVAHINSQTHGHTALLEGFCWTCCRHPRPSEFVDRRTQAYPALFADAGNLCGHVVGEIDCRSHSLRVAS